MILADTPLYVPVSAHRVRTPAGVARAWLAGEPSCRLVDADHEGAAHRSSSSHDADHWASLPDYRALTCAVTRAIPLTAVLRPLSCGPRTPALNAPAARIAGPGRTWKPHGSEARDARDLDRSGLAVPVRGSDCP